MSSDDPTPAATADRAALVGFVMEQTLGHITHSANLTALVPDAGVSRGIEPVFLPISFDLGRAERVPGWSNWTLRSGVRAQQALRRLDRSSPPDALFVHTQVAAILLGRAMRRHPTIVSIDATPLQYDELGEFYRHSTGPALVERAKHALHRRAFHRARGIVAWSQWAKDDLVARYGVDAADITVIPPGVDVDRWQPSPRVDGDERPLEVLFVGGDLSRKGGDLLIAACDQLRNDDDVPAFELHLVTGADVAPRPGVVVHHGLTPNSPELVARFRSADVFSLPTHGDCLPLVLAEAGAAGLPSISTSVGAIHEIVQPGVTGEVVTPGDGQALAVALKRLLRDPELRKSYGANARAVVEREHDARANAGRILDVISGVLAER